MARLGDIGAVITGNTPKTSDSENYVSNDICFVKPSDISDSEITYLQSSEFFISDSARCKARIAPENSILVTCIGIIGKVAINQVECAFNQQINAVIPDINKCLSNYVAYAIESQKDIIQGIANAAVVPIINKSQFSNIEIPLPSLDTQRHIAAVLDKVSDLIALRKQQLAKLDELVKARFVEMFGDCKTNPFNWQTVALGDIADVGSSKRVFVEELQESGIPFYRGTEVGALAEGKTISPELFITEEHYQKLCEASGKPYVGDLLMPSICPDGRIWVVDTDKPFYFKDGRVLWVHPHSQKFDSTFLLYTLKDRIIADYSSIASGTTFAELKIFSLKACRIFNATIELQKQFSSFVQKANQSKLTVQQGLVKLETLKSALMQEYFG